MSRPRTAPGTARAVRRRDHHRLHDPRRGRPVPGRFHRPHLQAHPRIRPGTPAARRRVGRRRTGPARHAGGSARATGGALARRRERLHRHAARRRRGHARPATRRGGDRAGFYDLGFDSVALLRLTERVEHLVGRKLYPTLLFEHTTIDALAAHLSTGQAPAVPPSSDAPVADAVPAPAAPEPAVLSFVDTWVPADPVPATARTPEALVVAARSRPGSPPPTWTPSTGCATSVTCRPPSFC
nr:acyl carrier protein [Micromonospora provocatoris]